MECNRDEALRAREIAEKKFMEKDFVGAKKFALKAHNLFPTLEGISQMISTLDIYISAETKFNGESDWYSILCVNALADDETVKKQYRKLALQLHPDKNKSPGAEGAFKLISEAWSVLSDKSRRTVYDQKRNIKGFQQRASQQSVPKNANGFYNFANNATSNARAQKSSAGSVPSTVPPSSHQSKPHTFWTSCNRCKMQYEYLRVYLNHNLLCPSCHEPFLAVETRVPSNRSNSSAKQHQHISNHNSTVKNAYGPGKNASAVPGMGSTGFHHEPSLDSSNFQWGPFSRTAGAASAFASSSAAAQAANMVHQTYEKVKREREESQAAARKEALRRKNHASKRTSSGSVNPQTGSSPNIPDGERPLYPRVDRPAKKRRSIGDDYGTTYGVDGKEQMVTGMSGASEIKVSASNKCVTPNIGVSGTERANGVFGDSSKGKVSCRQNNLSRELSQMDIRNVLMENAKMVIHKKLEEWRTAAEAKSAEKEKAKQKQKQKENSKGKENTAVQRDAADQIKLDESRNNNRKDSSTEPGSDMEVIKPVSIDVPDSDFHDFDKDRSESSFEADQVWATYDNEDGMPRYYAFVQKVISLKPFKVRMSFLTSKSNSEFGPLNWVASGFAKTCGDYRVGRYEVNDTVNIFSHRVRWEKGSRGIIRIVPRKGDIWALYRNWSPDWDEHTPDDVMYKYDMVEVLDDYNEEQGVSVTPLVKVADFKTVFHRHMDPKEVKRIPRAEMFRFSHQVPSYLLTGEEAQNAPKGCRELDPAATPLELLQVITEAKEDEVVETAEQ